MAPNPNFRFNPNVPSFIPSGFATPPAAPAGGRLPIVPIMVPRPPFPWAQWIGEHQESVHSGWDERDPVSLVHVAAQILSQGDPSQWQQDQDLCRALADAITTLPRTDDLPEWIESVGRISKVFQQAVSPPVFASILRELNVFDLQRTDARALSSLFFGLSQFIFSEIFQSKDLPQVHRVIQTIVSSPLPPIHESACIGCLYGLGVFSALHRLSMEQQGVIAPISDSFRDTQALIHRLVQKITCMPSQEQQNKLVFGLALSGLWPKWALPSSSVLPLIQTLTDEQQRYNAGQGSFTQNAVHQAIVRTTQYKALQNEAFVNGFWVDYLLPQERRIIEMDGWSHVDPVNQMKDQLRDAVLRFLGFTVIRIALTGGKNRQTLIQEVFDALAGAAVKPSVAMVPAHVPMAAAIPRPKNLTGKGPLQGIDAWQSAALSALAKKCSFPWQVAPQMPIRLLLSTVEAPECTYYSLKIAAFPAQNGQPGAHTPYWEEVSQIAETLLDHMREQQLTFTRATPYEMIDWWAQNAKRGFRLLLTFDELKKFAESLALPNLDLHSVQPFPVEYGDYAHFDDYTLTGIVYQSAIQQYEFPGLRKKFSDRTDSSLLSDGERFFLRINSNSQAPGLIFMKIALQQKAPKVFSTDLCKQLRGIISNANVGYLFMTPETANPESLNDFRSGFQIVLSQRDFATLCSTLQFVEGDRGMRKLMSFVQEKSFPFNPPS